MRNGKNKLTHDGAVIVKKKKQIYFIRRLPFYK